MDAIIVFSFIICMAVVIKFIVWRDDKRQLKQGV